MLAVKLAVLAERSSVVEREAAAEATMAVRVAAESGREPAAHRLPRRATNQYATRTRSCRGSCSGQACRGTRRAGARS